MKACNRDTVDFELYAPILCYVIWIAKLRINFHFSHPKRSLGATFSTKATIKSTGQRAFSVF